MATNRQSAASLSVGMLLFPRLTILDLAGPYEVLGRMPATKIHLIAARSEPIRTEQGMLISSDTSFEDAPHLDMLFVPGGPGQEQAIEDETLLRFLRERGQQARFITSVCTGSLILGAAGLLRGYRATTHWRYLDMLSLFGAEPVEERVVIDRNRITGAGVSSGIDLALVIAATLFGPTIAQQIQLGIEYDPAPPFPGGSPKSAPGELLQKVTAFLNPAYERRRKQIEQFLEREKDEQQE